MFSNVKLEEKDNPKVFTSIVEQKLLGASNHTSINYITDHYINVF